MDYVQVKLVHPDRRSTRVAWLPRQEAQKGRRIRLLNDHGEWQDGWIVARAVSEGMYDTMPSVTLPDLRTIS